MANQFLNIAQRRLLRPASKFLDTCADVFIAPRHIARLCTDAAHAHPSWRAAAFFVSGFSSGLGLTSVALRVLQVGSLDEVLFWIFHITFFVLATSLSVAFTAAFSSVRPAQVLRAAAYSYGAAHFFGGLVLAGAAIGVGFLHHVGYIPEIKQDQTDWTNIEGAMQNRICVSARS